MKEKILIVDSEEEIAKTLDNVLKNEGYKTFLAGKTGQALVLAKREIPDIIILDPILPNTQGFEVCSMLKNEPETSHIPIIIVTRRAEEADKVLGLELGADDYVTKPFSPRELTARIKVVLRRSRNGESIPEALKIGSLTIDFSRIRVLLKESSVALTAKEFELLKTLVKARGKIVSRDYLLGSIWGMDHPHKAGTRTLDVHVRTLRIKLRDEASRLVTVKNYGYRFESDEI